MKELESPQLQLRPDTQLVAEINKEYTLKLTLQKRPGMILFGVNPYEGFKCEPIKIITEAFLTYDKNVKTKNRANYDHNLLYIWAINKENAIRKAKKQYIV
jgi:hypothetical protein